jgi:predicted DsbA family dithiol-disulfide isomerase
LKELVFQAYYTNNIYLDKENLVLLAGQAGYDETAARAHLDSEAALLEVKRRSDAAKRAGVSGVPFILINDTPTFSGAQEPRVFAQALRKAAK